MRYYIRQTIEMIVEADHPNQAMDKAWNEEWLMHQSSIDEIEVEVLTDGVDEGFEQHLRKFEL